MLLTDFLVVVISSDLSLSSSTYVVPETSRGIIRWMRIVWLLIIFGVGKFISFYFIDLGVQTQRTCKTLDLEEVQDFAKQIVRGMEHLEKKNITHRFVAN